MRWGIEMRARSVAASVLVAGVLLAGTAGAADARPKTLHLHDRGARVLTVEKRLVKLGYLAHADRKLSKSTIRAVRKMQKRNHWRMTHAIGPVTYKRILSAHTKPAHTVPTVSKPPSKQPSKPLAPKPSSPAKSPTVTTKPPVANPKVMVHRGGHVAPENTVAAFLQSAPLSDYVEWDVQWTSDDEMVVIHDRSLDRTTDCTGLVSEHTLVEIEDCNVDGGGKVPTFAQALAAVKPTGKWVAPELAHANATDAEIAQFWDAVVTYGSPSRTLMQIFEPATAAKFRALSSTAHIALLPDRGLMPADADLRAYDAVMLPWSKYNATEIARASKLTHVIVWTPNTDADLAKAVALHPYAICTDEPAALNLYLATHG